MNLFGYHMKINLNIYITFQQKMHGKNLEYFLIINTYYTEKNQLILVCTSQKDFLPSLEALLKT